METQMFGSSFDALKVDLCKYQKHLHLLVTMAQESIKKTRGVRALLYMKSDKAKETMKTIVTDHQNQLRTIAYKFEQDIDDFVSRKENELQTRNEGLLKQMQMCEDMINSISSVLADDSRCLNMGKDIVTTCVRLFDSGFDCIDVDDFHYLSFMPLTQGVLKPEEIGYVKYCDIDLEMIDVLSDVFEDRVMKAVCNQEESILIQTNQRCNKEVFNCLKVQILDPTGQEVKVTVEDNHNGSYLANYVPEKIGFHILHVKMFDVDIKGSPFQIDVIRNLYGVKMEVDSTDLMTAKHELWAVNDMKKEIQPAETSNCTPDDLKLAEKDCDFDYLDKPFKKINQQGNCCEDNDNTQGNFNNSVSEIVDQMKFNKSEQMDLTEVKPKASAETFQLGVSSEACIAATAACNGENMNDQNTYANLSFCAISKNSAGLEMDSSEKFEKTGDNNEYLPLLESRIKEISLVSSTFSYILGQYIKLGKDKVRTELVRKIGHPGSQNDSLFFPIGVTVNGQGEVIVCDTRHNAVKVFTADGDFRLAIKGEQKSNFYRPSAAVVNDKSEVFVKDDHGIYVFDNDGNFLREIGVGQVERPYGLAFDKDGHLIVFDHGRQQPRLCVFTQEGQLLECNGFKPLMNMVSKSGSKCRFLECVDESVFVVDLGKSVIHISDIHGNAVGTFGHFGKNIGEFNEPSGITKDSSGMLLIADSRNNRIQVFSPDGTVHGILDMSKDIVRPSDIHLSSEGYLYVSNYLQHCIKVFRILPPD